MAAWKFQLLGEFVVRSSDGRELPLRRRKHQALIALVLLADGKRILRDKLIEILWGVRSEEQARASLRGALSEIKRTFRAFGDCPIEADRQSVFVADPRAVEIDLDPLLDGDFIEDVDNLAGLVKLNGGELLNSLRLNENEFELWKETMRERFHQLYRSILFKYLSQTDNDDDEHEYAAKRMLALNEADEDAIRALMKLYHRQGNSSQALLVFERGVEKLRENHGAVMSEKTKAAARKIRLDTANSEATGDRPEHNGLKIAHIGASDLSLAILPLSMPSCLNLGDNFGYKLAGEIVKEASRFRWFKVVSISETAKFDDGKMGLSELSVATGAKYILSGNIEKVDDGFQLEFLLKDGKSTIHVWDCLIQLETEEIGNTQLICEYFLGQLDVALRLSEVDDIRRRKPSTGYEHTMMALSAMYDFQQISFEKTEELFQKAIDHGPVNSWTYSFWALWKMFALGQNWIADPKAGFKHARELARNAKSHDPRDAIAWVVEGHFDSFWRKQFGPAKNSVDRARELNPYSAFVWMLSSATYSYIGQAEEALRQLEKSRALSQPEDDRFMFMFDSAECLAHLYNHDAEKAAEWGEKIISDAEEFTNGHKQFLVALGHLGKTGEAKEVLEALMALEPDFNVRDFLDTYPFKRDEDREYFREGLRLAGVPLSKVNINHLTVVE
jgi:DNA-binding SARP family transcriptional activator